MPRGRAPSPQSNRTDQLSPSAVPNQAYGERAQQIAAQQAIPMAGAPNMAANTPPAPPGGPGASPPSPQGAPGQDIMAMMQAHAGANGAGRAGPLTRPTERPNEPVTTGLPVGAGAGPEALTGVGAMARNNNVEQGTLSNLLQSMASAPGATSAIKDLAARAGQGVM